MKKLIIAALAVAFGAAAQASVVNWKTGTGNQVYLMNATDRAAGLTVYLFTSETISQTDLLAAVRSGTDISTLGAKDTVATTSTGVVSGSFEADAGYTFNGYFAILASVDGADYLYISTVASATAPGTGGATATFKEKATSTLAASSGDYTGAGWYQTVPEPTSGLLVLIGMAGLALRRRRA